MATGLPIPTRYDAAWKVALERFFQPFLALCFPQFHTMVDWSVAPKFLDKELQQLAPQHGQGDCRVDHLVEVRLASGALEWLLIHVEVQAQPDPNFPLRMWVYSYRLWDKYQRPAVSLAVLADPNPEWRPDTYRTALGGCVQRFQFPVFKVLDLTDPVAEFERTRNPFALVVAAHQAALRLRPTEPARVEARLALVKQLYNRGLARDDAVALLRLIGWLTILPPDLELQFRAKLATLEQVEKVMTVETLIAPWEWVEREQERQAGRQEGRQEGHQTGLERGALIGHIQAYQELLGAPVSARESLADREIEALRVLSRALEAEFRGQLAQLRGQITPPGQAS